MAEENVLGREESNPNQFALDWMAKMKQEGKDGLGVSAALAAAGAERVKVKTVGQVFGSENPDGGRIRLDTGLREIPFRVGVISAVEPLLIREGGRVIVPYPRLSENGKGVDLKESYLIEMTGEQYDELHKKISGKEKAGKRRWSLFGR